MLRRSYATSVTVTTVCMGPIGVPVSEKPSPTRLDSERGRPKGLKRTRQVLLDTLAELEKRIDESQAQPVDDMERAEELRKKLFSHVPSAVPYTMPRRSKCTNKKDSSDVIDHDVIDLT
eukprot:26974-Rhodomonas_salina.6